MENRTATQSYMARIEHPDKRRMRAIHMTAAIMQEIEDLVDYQDARGRIYDRLYDLFYENGASIMTDVDRAKEGLEPRDAKGWTPSEKLALKRAEIETLQMMASSTRQNGFSVIGSNTTSPHPCPRTDTHSIEKE